MDVLFFLFQTFLNPSKLDSPVQFVWMTSTLHLNFNSFCMLMMAHIKFRRVSRLLLLSRTGARHLLQRFVHTYTYIHTHMSLKTYTVSWPQYAEASIHNGYTELSFFDPALSLDKLAITPLLFPFGAAASAPCAPSIPTAISSIRRRAASSCTKTRVS